ncbi:MAG: response regulator transcription factor [Cyanobacteria bacterium J06621_8]
MIRILIVDDQNLIQQGIKSLLEKDPAIEVIGTVRDGRSAIKQIGILQPDIVLLDIEMPGMDGITATKHISRLSPAVKIIILTSHDDKKYLAQALMAGAKSYILKNSLTKDLRQAILSVYAGYSHIESRLLAKLFTPDNSQSKVKKSPSPSKKAHQNNLTLRQQQHHSSAQLPKPSPTRGKSKPADVSIFNQELPGGQSFPSQHISPIVETLPLSSQNKHQGLSTVEIFPETDTTLISETKVQEHKIRGANKLEDATDLEHNLATVKQESNPASNDKFLPAPTHHRSSATEVPHSFNFLSQIFPEEKNLIQIFNQPLLEPYRKKAVQLYNVQRKNLQSVIALARVKFNQYKSQLIPLIQKWQRQGWLANLELILLGVVTAVIIHLIFF